MSVLLSSAALSLLAVIIVWFMGRRDPARSPLLTLGSLLTLLALPLLAFLPKINVELAALASSAEGQASTGSISAVTILALLWLSGFLFFALRWALDLRSLCQWRRLTLDLPDEELEELVETCRQQLGLRHKVRVRFHPDPTSPWVAGLFRPVIYLPVSSRDWTEETMRMVLLHELGHVARRDLWTNLTAHLACLVYWFNPLVWWLRRRLMAQCEFACDEKVLSVGADPAHYAHALCDVAEAGTLPRAALAMAGRASLRDRVERVVQRNGKPGAVLVAIALTLTISASLALSVVRLTPAELALLPDSGSGNSAPVAPVEDFTQADLDRWLSANPFPGNDKDELE